MTGRFTAFENERGFTLTELLVAAGLSLFVLASIGSLFRAQTHTIKGQESRMEAHEYASIRQMQGSMSYRSVTDPTAFERANYMRVLSSYVLRR